MVELVLPDSSFYIQRARNRIDPFMELAGYTDQWEFATCGMVVLEVCRGLRDVTLLQRARDRFAVMLCVATGSSTWERSVELAWALDRRGMVIPTPDLLIAACALQAGAAVLTTDAHFREIPRLRILEKLG